MYINFMQDREEILKIKLLENYQGNYYQNTNLIDFDRRTSYLLIAIYVIGFSSLFCYSMQSSLPLLSKYYRKF
jgi:hypothetical protein